MDEMKPVEEIYGGRFFKKRNSLGWRAEIVCEVIWKELKPKDVIDVGCAIGDIVRGFLEIGIDARGLEGSQAAIPYLEVSPDKVFFCDLRWDICVGRYDLATCFEVAEHIEPEYAEQFVKNLTGMSHRILMSAAPPGQGGHHHVNCREMEYWEELFREKGYCPDGNVADRIRQQLHPWRKKPGIKAYYDNLVYFERQK